VGTEIAFCNKLLKLCCKLQYIFNKSFFLKIKLNFNVKIKGFLFKTNEVGLEKGPESQFLVVIFWMDDP